MPRFRKRAFDGHTLLTLTRMCLTRALSFTSHHCHRRRTTAAATPPPPDIRAFSAAAPSVNISRFNRTTAPCALTANSEMRLLPPRRTSSAFECQMQPRCPNIAAAMGACLCYVSIANSVRICKNHTHISSVSCM